MLITLKRIARSGFSSTLSLATVRWSPYSLAISLRIGAICLHGPHHSAQKSTTTGVDDALTVSSNVELVTVTIPSATEGPFREDGRLSVGTGRRPLAFPPRAGRAAS